MTKIWLTSDTHYSHKNTLRYCGRPFWTIDACDEAMIKRWNAVVKPEDTVYHLGDVAMHTVPMKRLLPRLNGNKILIVGNHDLMYSYFLKSRGQKFVDKMTKDYLDAGFAEINTNEVLCLALPANSQNKLNESGGCVRLSHFPTKNISDEFYNDRHSASRPEDDGILNICGHVHQHWLKRGNNINVGVDVWDFTPVSLDTIIELWHKGPENLPAPKVLRIIVWKLYHTIVWRLNNVVNFLKRRVGI